MINDLLSRIGTIPGLTNPPINREYTFAELDANLKIIYDAFNSLLTAGLGNISPWNSSSTYSNSGPSYVSFNGNIWRCLIASSLNQDPVTFEGTSWELVSVGELTHVQGSDNTLAFGTANQVTALEIRTLLDTMFIIVADLSALAILRNTSSLKPNRTYFSTADNVFIKSHSTSQVSHEALLLLVVPQYNILPLWDGASAPYSVNTRVVFGSSVYKCIGALNTDVFPWIDAGNWEFVSSSDANYYQSLPIEVLLSQSLTGILSFKDKSGNELPFSMVSSIRVGDDNTASNRLFGSDIFSAINLLSCSSAVGNTVLSGSLYVDGVRATAFENVVNGGTVTVGFLGAGFLLNNYFGIGVFEVQFEDSEGMELCRMDLPPWARAVAHRLRGNRSYTEEVVTPEGTSTIAEEYLITGLSAVDVSLAGAVSPELVGVIKLASAGATETLNRIQNPSQTLRKIKIAPVPGLILTLTGTSVLSIVDNGRFLLPATIGSSLVLNGGNGDYCEGVYEDCFDSSPYKAFKVLRIHKPL